MNPFFLSCSLPPNTEGSAEPCEVIGASLPTQVRILFDRFTHTYFHSFVSAYTCPFRRLRRHLPRIRGRLFLCETFPYFSVLLIQKYEFFLP